MQILFVLFVVLVVLSELLQWSLMLQMEQDVRRIQKSWQRVVIYKRSDHEIGDVHPFTPDATLTARDVNQQREVVESSP